MKRCLSTREKAHTIILFSQIEDMHCKLEQTHIMPFNGGASTSGECARPLLLVIRVLLPAQVGHAWSACEI